jgi:hypothetical protein
MMNFLRRLFQKREITRDIFPSPPFDATIDAGAIVYGPSTGTQWGTVRDGSIYTRGVVTGVLGDKFKIGSPLWSNGKEWAVKQINVHLVVEPPPATKTLVYRLEVFDDLSAVIYDKDGNVLWQSS